jgi:adenylyl-sulfate kinase
MDQSISPSEQAQLMEQTGSVLWFTGLSGSGKSTTAKAVQRGLYNQGKKSYVLDGDNLRLGLNKGLGFSVSDREENLRRVAEVAKILKENSIIALCCFISPFKTSRDVVADICGEHFYEIYMNTPLDVCEAKDPKGLYKKARAGHLKNFTGIDQVYEPPEAPSLKLNACNSTAQLADEVIHFLSEIDCSN